MNYKHEISPSVTPYLGIVICQGKISVSGVQLGDVSEVVV